MRTLLLRMAYVGVRVTVAVMVGVEVAMAVSVGVRVEISVAVGRGELVADGDGVSVGTSGGAVAV
jgi:hypothetical protein